MSFLELADLSKSYGGRAVVDHVSLDIAKGTLVSLLGPSGCGKTTTLRLLAGFIEPDGGEIRVGAKRIAAPGASLPPERRNMAMIFQSYALWPHMTVRQNVAYGLELRRIDKADMVKRTDAVLALTQLSPFAERYPGELSGGQQQRVSLARALVVEPEILLLDEPLSNLDANLREEMRYEIRRLHEERNCTTVYVTHDQSEAMSTADLIVVMSNGRIEQAGSPEDIYQRPMSEFVARFIGGTNILKGQNAGADAVQCGGGLLLRCGSGEMAQHSGTAVSIRPHQIGISAGRSGASPDAAPSDATNAAAGTVTRHTFLGSHRSYLVEMAAGDTVQVIAEPERAYAKGQGVWLQFPQQHCRALAR